MAHRDGDVAQMGERLPCTEEVRGSSPLISTENGIGERGGGSGVCGSLFVWKVGRWS